MFAKLYERNGKQVLVKCDADREEFKPEVRFFFKPDNLGVCSVAISYKDDSPKSWDSAEKFFDEVDEDKAFDFADKAITEILNATG